MKPKGSRGGRRPTLGLVEWFRVGERARVEQVLSDLRRLGIRDLRTGISWADWHRPEGRRWYEWLIPTLAREIDLIPCFTYVPPSRAMESRSNAPPRRLLDYADFLDQMVTLFGRHFEWVELWNEPNNLEDWDWRLDPGWERFAEMVGAAAAWMQQRGKRTLLGGTSPTDAGWLELMFERGVMEHIDAIGLHGFPGTWDAGWAGWDTEVGNLREVLARHDSGAQLWVTEAGYSTWRHDEKGQAEVLLSLLEAPVERAYWYSALDLAPDQVTQHGRFHDDERHYHFGLRRADGTPKLLHRLWASGGLDKVREVLELARTRPVRRNGHAPTLITGGSGFVGANLADRILSSGREVILFDALAREGVEQNAEWLKSRHGDRVHLVIGDIRDPWAVRELVRVADSIFHFAAQVAVTTSLDDPLADHDVNVGGTVGLLEAIRRLDDPPPLLFTSTNKVYGGLPDVAVREHGQRYEPVDPAIRESGISESRPLEFHSPYGCSKGAADQYVLDFARTFGLPALVFRMSCIYGPRQFGTEDQGWVAHFLIRALEGDPITLFGDGKQVRDVLFVDDLMDAMLTARAHVGTLAGRAFNIGGGPANTTSLLELLDLIERLRGERPAYRLDDWRLADQRYYVSDIRAFSRATGWRPRVDVEQGVARLLEWLLAFRASGASSRVASPEIAAPQVVTP